MQAERADLLDRKFCSQNPFLTARSKLPTDCCPTFPEKSLIFGEHSAQLIDMYSTAVSDYCRANRGTITLAITWVLSSIGILVVGLRLYLRFGPRYKIGWDDYTAMASLVSSPILLY